MDPVSYAIRKVMNGDIPDQILEDAFLDTSSRRRRNPTSIENEIRKKIIHRRVQPDLSSLGGIEVDINLSGLPYDFLSSFERIYTIPSRLTNGRNISQVMYVALAVTSNYAERIPGQSSKSFTVSPVERSAQSVIQGYKPIPNIANAECELLGDNVLKINDYMGFTYDLELRCLLEFTPDLMEIKRPYHEPFAQLVNLATKAYIYKNLSLSLDRARLDGGREFNRYKEFVDGYSDANDMYQSLLDEKWTKWLILNDPQQKQAHILRAGRIKT